MSTPIDPTDLTLRPPRSPRVRLGGLAIIFGEPYADSEPIVAPEPGSEKK